MVASQRRLSRRWTGAVVSVGLGLTGTATAIALSATPASAATDLATGKTAAADSSQTGHDPTMANDDNAGTRWCAADSKTGHWWQVDLGSTSTLTGTQVVWEFARNYKYQIAVSTDGTTFTTVADQTANTSAVQTQADTFSATARYVRITVTGLAARTWASIQSFAVFGSGGTVGPNPDPATRAQCTGIAPITCHFDVAPGNYDVTVVLGDADAAGVTSVSGEARRSLLPTVTTAAGELRRLSFTMNVRKPEGQPTGQGGTGTDGLDLLFSGSAPKLNGIGYAAATNPTMLYLIGDSTVCDQPTAPYTGWGQQLPPAFNLGLSVANYADSGESSVSVLSNSTLFPAVKALLKTGDYVLIQVGHNDKTTTKAVYQANLTSMVTQVKSKGAIPVLVTPPVRRDFTNGQLVSDAALHVTAAAGSLPAAMKEVATAQNVGLIDLTTKSKNLLEGLGPVASAQLYLNDATDGITDNTHFSAYGAGEMARLVLQGVTELNITGLTDRLR